MYSVYFYDGDNRTKSEHVYSVNGMLALLL